MNDVLQILFMEHSVPIRERMAELITESMSDVQIHHADGSEDALIKLEAYQPDVLFIDPNFRIPVLPEFIAKAKELLPEMLVVVVYIQINEALVEKCKAAGAAGFLDKYEQFDQVVGLLHYFKRNRGI
jgi:DNA-binding NarL/FixJ family response regulator